MQGLAQKRRTIRSVISYKFTDFDINEIHFFPTSWNHMAGLSSIAEGQKLKIIKIICWQSIVVLNIRKATPSASITFKCIDCTWKWTGQVDKKTWQTNAYRKSKLTCLEITILFILAEKWI